MQKTGGRLGLCILILAALIKSAAQNPTIVSFNMARDSAFGSVWDTYDTTLVAYNALQSNGYYGVYFAHVTAGNQLINETCFTCNDTMLPGKNVGAPAFQPGGKYVAVVAEKASHPGSSGNSVPGVGTFCDVWVITRDGQKAYQLTNEPDTGSASGVIFPFFSPDGKEFMWTEMAGPVDIANGKQEFGYWVIKIADFTDDSLTGPSLTNIRVLQPGGTPAFNEAYGWSPDGSQIIFASDYNQFWVWDDQIYEMDTNGNNISQLTACCDYNEHAFYSPDGQHIVWMTNTGTNTGTTLGGDDWFIMHPDGSDMQRFTFFNDTTSMFWNGSTHILGHGCFSPSGSRIIGDVGGSEPIQLDPSQIGAVYLYELNNYTTAISSPVAVSGCRLYPNPADDALRVMMNNNATGNIYYTIYNITGSAVAAGEAPAPDFTVDVSNYTGGLYFMKLLCGNNTANAKFVVAGK